MGFKSDRLREEEKNQGCRDDLTDTLLSRSKSDPQPKTGGEAMDSQTSEQEENEQTRAERTFWLVG